MNLVQLFGAVPPGKSDPSSYYTEPIPELEISGVCSFPRLLLAIWQLRPADLQRQFPLDAPDGRKQYLAWCVLHGRREYAAVRELQSFWDELAMPADIPPTPWSPAISRLMQLVILARPDLGIPPALDDQAAQQCLVSWFFVANGMQECGFGREHLSAAQLATLLGQNALEESKFAGLVWASREDLQQNFPNPGGTDFQDWMRLHGMRETALPCLMDVNEPITGENRAQPMEFGVNLIGYAYGELGIGEDVRMAARALEAAGIPFAILNINPSADVRNRDLSCAEHVSPTPRYQMNMVCLTALEHLRYFVETGQGGFGPGPTIGYWPWELARFPEEWHHCASLADELWASSRHTASALRQAHRHVRLMPMAVVIPELPPLGRAHFGLPDAPYLFVFSFDGNSTLARKNPNAAVRAFQRAFPPGDSRVGLVIKCMRPDRSRPEWIEIAAMAQKDARIVILDKVMDKTEVLALYRNCDCYVSLHRSEGYGRGIAEALLLGLEVIATGYGGNVDFMRSVRAHLVPYRMKRLKPEDYVGSAGQAWASPNETAAARQMRQALDTHVHRTHPLTRFNPDRIGHRYAQRLRQLML